MPIRRTSTALAIAIATFIAAPVAADCNVVGTPAEVLPTADVAFVGTVTAVDGTVATFAVGEVWAGPVGETIEVIGLLQMHPHGPEEAIPMEDDRLWVVGRTYLVIPRVTGGVVHDDLCTATTEWTDELEELRPDGTTVLEAPSEGYEVPTAVFLIGLAVIVVGGVSMVAFSRGRRTSSPPTR